MSVEMPQYGAIPASAPRSEQEEDRQGWMKKRGGIMFFVVVIMSLMVMSSIQATNNMNEAANKPALAENLVIEVDTSPPTSDSLVWLSIHNRMTNLTKQCSGLLLTKKFVLSAKSCFDQCDLSIDVVSIFGKDRTTTDITMARMAYFPVDKNEEWLYMLDVGLMVDAVILRLGSVMPGTPHFLQGARQLGTSSLALPVNTKVQAIRQGKIGTWTQSTTQQFAIEACTPPLTEIHTKCAKPDPSSANSLFLGGEPILLGDRLIGVVPSPSGTTVAQAGTNTKIAFEWLASPVTRAYEWVENTVEIPETKCEEKIHVLGDVSFQSQKTTGGDQTWRVVRHPPNQVVDGAISESGAMWTVNEGGKLWASHGYFNPTTNWTLIQDMDLQSEMRSVGIESFGCRVAAVRTDGKIFMGDRHPVVETEDFSVIPFYPVLTIGHKLEQITFGTDIAFAKTQLNILLAMTRFPRGLWVTLKKFVKHISAHGSHIVVVDLESRVWEMDFDTVPGKWVRVHLPMIAGKLEMVSIGRDGELMGIFPGRRNAFKRVLMRLDRAKGIWVNVFFPGMPAMLDVESQNRVLVSARNGYTYMGAISHSLTTTFLKWVQAGAGQSCSATCQTKKMSPVSGDPLNPSVAKGAPAICAASKNKHTSEGLFVGWNEEKALWKEYCTIPGVSLTTIFNTKTDFECLCRESNQAIVWEKLTEECRDCEEVCGKKGVRPVQSPRPFVDVGAINVCTARDDGGSFRPGYNFHLMPGCYVSPLRPGDVICMCTNHTTTSPPTESPTRLPSTAPSKTTTTQEPTPPVPVVPSRAPSNTPTMSPTPSTLVNNVTTAGPTASPTCRECKWVCVTSAPVTAPPPTPPCGDHKTMGDCNRNKCFWNDPPELCQCPSANRDFMFLVDSSWSVNDQEFAVQRAALKDMVVNILPRDSGVGILQFSGYPDRFNIDVPLFPRKAISTVATTIDAMKPFRSFFAGGARRQQTHIGAAMQKGLSSEFLGNSGIRPNPYLVLITDGENTGSINPCDVVIPKKCKSVGHWCN